MKKLSRRNFLQLTTGAFFVNAIRPPGKVITVNGAIDSYRLGQTLIHEHVLVDFIGADQTNQNRWDKVDVVNKVAPYFEEAKAAGVKTIVECTPAFLGRDVRLLKMLSDKTKMQVITNTGYYGAVENRYLPSWAFTETAEQLAQRWTDDFEYGIEGTNIRPGFIKISVDAKPGGLSEVHKKLVRAAAITHLKTGLTIYSHTGAGNAALEQIEILKKEKVHPAAFVWVHAQAEEDLSLYVKAARMGAWVSLDNVTADVEKYVMRIERIKQEGLLDKILISHDAGYYRPGEKEGGQFIGYTAIFRHLIPALNKIGLSRKDIRRLLVRNPEDALQLNVRKYRG